MLVSEGYIFAGMARHEFVLHYQPVVEIATSNIMGAEALLRWRRDDEVITAGEFFDAIERSPAIIDIGAWVTEQACRQEVLWHDAMPIHAWTVGINVSGREASMVDVERRLLATAAMTGADLRRITVELTERTLLEASDAFSRGLRRLNRLGVFIALDDFGTGFSSYNHIRRFPVDGIKVDRSFVACLPQSREDRAIVTSIVALAHSLDVVVIAEGVETEVQYDMLRTLGCDAVQGNLLHPALPATQIDRLLNERRAPPGD